MSISHFSKNKKWILEDLHKSGLSDDTIDEMGIKEIKGTDALKDMIGFAYTDGQSIPQTTECYAIPYPGEKNFVRIKLQSPIPMGNDGKKAKYLSPKESESSLYYLPSEFEKLKSPKYSVIITEGEKKTAKLTQECRHMENITALGIPGVTMWKGISLGNRKVYLSLDADFQENPMVANQLLSLWLYLRKKKSIPYILSWPIKEGKGIDDYLVAQEKEGRKASEALQELLDRALDNPFGIIPNITEGLLAKYLAMHCYKIAEIKVLYNKYALEKKLDLDFETFKDLYKDAVREAKKQKQQSDGKSQNDIFWYESEPDAKGCSSLQISHVNLIKFLEKAGFCFILTEKNSECVRVMVKIQEMIVEEVDLFYVRKFVWDFVEKQPRQITPEHTREELLEVLKKGIFNYVNNDTINLINQRRLDFLTDTKDKSFIPFKNGVAVISKECVTMQGYASITGYIWKSQILGHDFQVEDKGKVEHFDFYKFTERICTENKSVEKGRHKSLLCSLGYMLHNYRTPANKFALILSEASLDENPQGRTGKGLLMQAIGKIRKTVTIDGKNFNFDSPFAFQNVTIDTQILFFDDVKKNFNFQRLYSAITEGLSFERKNKDRVNLSPEASPKITISTNYAIKGNSESDKGRKFEMELLCYYSTKNRPVDEFRREFFHSWDVSDWNTFYNFMLHCIQMYFINDCKIPTYTSEILIEKKLLLETSPEFVEYAKKFITGTSYQKGDARKAFLFLIEQSDDHKGADKVTAEKFHKWLKKYAEYKGLELKEDRTKTERTFTFVKK